MKFQSIKRSCSRILLNLLFFIFIISFFKIVVSAERFRSNINKYQAQKAQQELHNPYSPSFNDHQQGNGNIIWKDTDGGRNYKEESSLRMSESLNEQNNRQRQAFDANIRQQNENFKREQPISWRQQPKDTRPVASIGAMGDVQNNFNNELLMNPFVEIDKDFGRMSCRNIEYEAC